MEDALLQTGIAIRLQQSVHYDNGDVLLVAGDRSFRVHSTVLSNHSLVFREIFQNKSPLQKPYLDGSRVVNLSDDPDDVVLFLNVLYRGELLFIDGLNYLSMSSIDRYMEIYLAAGYLAIAAKYGVESFCMHALSRIMNYYPATLEQFDQMSWDSADVEALPHESQQKDAAILPTVGTAAIFVVIAARRIQKPLFQAILPFIYYLYCQLPSELIVRGIPRPHGGQQYLSREDQKIFIFGRRRLLVAATMTTLCLSPSNINTHSQCLTKNTCRLAMGRMLIAASENGLLHRTLALLDLGIWIETAGSHVEICSICVRFIKEVHHVQRQQIWNDLPICFNPQVLQDEWKSTTFDAYDYVRQ